MGFLSGLLGSGGSSSSAPTTTAAQNTSNADAGATSTAINLSGLSTGKGGSNNITVQSLDAGVVKNALASNLATVGGALDFASESANRAFDFLDNNSTGFLELLQEQQKENQYATIRANDLTASAANQVLSLAGDKTTTTDERLIGLVKIGLAVVGVLIALALLFSPSRSKKAA